jgi:hypothetical protein
MPRLLDPLVAPLTDLLMLLTGVLHSYGLAIIVFTMLVRMALAPLTLRQLRSAKKMAALAPRLKQLQQKYKGNREELVRAQMALYKEAGANPAGCLPLGSGTTARSSATAGPKARTSTRGVVPACSRCSATEPRAKRAAPLRP